MENIRILHNDEIKRIIMGTPIGHDHLRLLIEINDGNKLLLPEACIAAIVRAYCTIKTHPSVESLEMINKELPERKPGFAQYQLVEESRPNKEISNELKRIID